MSNEKPCRACMDFRTWAKRQKEVYDSEKVGRRFINKFIDIYYEFCRYCSSARSYFIRFLCDDLSRFLLLFCKKIYYNFTIS